MTDSVSMQLMRRSGPGHAAATPLLTIVVCAYNHARYVAECLEAINAVGGPDIDLIIVDDGSPDDTLQRCLRFAFVPDLTVQIYTKLNQGLVDSLREGLRLARGAYVAFIASDDFFIADGMLELIRLLKSNANAHPPDALLCQAQFLGTRADGQLVYGSAMQRFFEGTSAARVETICTEFPKPMLLQASAFRTTFLRELAPWNDGLELDDWPTFIRIFLAEHQRNANIKYLPCVTLSRYRLHGEGIHNNFERQMRVTLRVAETLVPLQFRAVCIANVQIDWGLAYLARGKWSYGSKLCLNGFRTSLSIRVVMRTLHRVGHIAVVIFRRLFRKRFI